VERTHQRCGLYWVRRGARFSIRLTDRLRRHGKPSTFGWGCPSSRQPIICPKVSCLENPAPHMPSGHLQLNRNHVRASANRSPSSYSWPKSRRIPFGSRVADCNRLRFLGVVPLRRCLGSLRRRPAKGLRLQAYDVRVGSDSDLDAPQPKVRFAPINRHHQRGAARPISADMVAKVFLE
jgi:hypothetical protein